MSALRSTTVQRTIGVPTDAVYSAFLDAEAVATWLPPGEMRGVVHAFEAREGGAFSMSLVYPTDSTTGQGKSSDTTDKFEGRFVRLVANREVVWATIFASADPAFAGEMKIRNELTPASNGTIVTITCEGIPSGIALEDNAEGCRLSLEQLAAFVGG
ncbi:SRPBCC domain-containing protein [Rhizobium sp. KVB221]|uniref:SRPBCC domain-containing protein n=1 Tax=Rhizobium setariae TaxID=2801340 RepID=A0A937CQG4_9HYPH|nr:SRPBCC domain-containing protein [Rhizobium setariae]MBL0374439.1 SRPBCC domain-containing protein [Rhizobium setariae]